MRRAFPPDPYGQVIQAFNRYGVKYVVIGMAGINYFAKSPRAAFATMDYDVFLDSTLPNIEKALQCLAQLEFTFGTSAGALKKGDLKEVVRTRKTLIATTPDGLMVELLLEISGYPFSELAKDAATIDVQGVPVKVGRLHKLLRSKKLAGRLKDRQFLQRYEGLPEEER